MMSHEHGVLRVGVGAAAAGLLLAASCDISHEPPLQAESQMTAPCYEPTAEEQAVVSQLFSKEPLYLHDSRYKDMQSHGVESAISKRFGMTLIPQSGGQKVEQDYTEHAPYKTIFHDAKIYLGEFGVQLRLARPQDFTGGYIGKVPTKQELNRTNASYDIAEVIDGFHELPLEYVAATGLKTILLIAHASGEAAYAKIGGPANTVAVNITATQAEPGPQLLDHEMYHLLDRRECTSASAQYIDPGYTALNNGDIYGPTNHTDALALDSPKISRLRDQHPKGRSDKQIYHKMLKNVVSYSSYGLTNVVEDKAEMGRNIAIPSDYSTVLSDRTPVIKRKFEYLMARLYHYQPAVVRYFAAISTRPIKPRTSPR